MYVDPQTFDSKYRIDRAKYATLTISGPVDERSKRLIDSLRPINAEAKEFAHTCVCNERAGKTFWSFAYLKSDIETIAKADAIIKASAVKDHHSATESLGGALAKRDATPCACPFLNTQEQSL